MEDKTIITALPETQIKTVPTHSNIKSVLNTKFNRSEKALKQRIHNFISEFRKKIPSKLNLNSNLVLIIKYIINKLLVLKKESISLNGILDDNRLSDLTKNVQMIFKKFINVKNINVLFDNLHKDKNIVVYLDSFYNNYEIFDYYIKSGFFNYKGIDQITIVINLNYFEEIINTRIIDIGMLNISSKEKIQSDKLTLQNKAINNYLINYAKSETHPDSVKNIIDTLKNSFYKAFVLSNYMESLRISHTKSLNMFFKVVNNEFPKLNNSSYIQLYKSFVTDNESKNKDFTKLVIMNNEEILNSLKYYIKNNIKVYPNLFDLTDSIKNNMINSFELHELIYEDINKMFDYIANNLKLNYSDGIDLYKPTYSYLEKIGGDKFNTIGVKGVEQTFDFSNLLKYLRIIPTILISIILDKKNTVSSEKIISIIKKINSLKLLKFNGLTKNKNFKNIVLLVESFKKMSDISNIISNKIFVSDIFDIVSYYMDYNPSQLEEFNRQLSNESNNIHFINNEGTIEKQDIVIEGYQKQLDLLKGFVGKVTISQYPKIPKNSSAKKIKEENRDLITEEQIFSIYDDHLTLIDRYLKKSKYNKIYKLIVNETYLNANHEMRLKKIYSNFMNNRKATYPIYVKICKFELNDKFFTNNEIKDYFLLTDLSVKKILIGLFFKDFYYTMNEQAKHLKNVGYSCDFDPGYKDGVLHYALSLFNNNIILNQKKEE